MFEEPPTRRVVDPLSLATVADSIMIEVADRNHYGVGLLIYGVGLLIYGVGLLIYGVGLLIYGVGLLIYGVGFINFRFMVSGIQIAISIYGVDLSIYDFGLFDLDTTTSPIPIFR